MAENDDRDARTEAATPRRRQDAREKGQVALSVELVAALCLLGWLGMLAFAGDTLAELLGNTLADGLSSIGERGRVELDSQMSASMLAGLGKSIGGVTLLTVAPLFALGWLAGYGQIGFAFSPKAIELDFGKLHPMRGWQRLFSARAFMRAALAGTKVLAIAVTMAAVAWTQRAHIAALADMELGPALGGAGHITLRCAAGGLAAVLALALFDFFFQRTQLERDLRMTRNEVREELRSTEGDPHVKARIRRLQRELARRRMLADVPRATVVITNPTHYAVALRYDREQRGRPVPRVVAKGVDRVALKIREIAAESGVIVYEEPPLARALHGRCEIGDEVPVELYQAVASVLAYVYRVQGVATAERGEG